MTLLKKTKTSLPAILAVAVILLGITGFSYAHWCATLYIDAEISSGVLCAEFGTLPPTFSDGPGSNDWNWNVTSPPWPLDPPKDIGVTNGQYVDEDGDGHPEKFEIIINNAYPWYYTHVDFWIHNCGTIPWILQNATITWDYGSINFSSDTFTSYIDLNGDGLNDIYIQWGDHFGDQLEPCEEFDISFAIAVLQDAPQNATLSFDITLCVIQYNLYQAP